MPPVLPREFLKATKVDHVVGSHGKSYRCNRNQRGRAQTALDERSLSQDRARAHLGYAFTVNLYSQDTIKQQVQLVARLTLPKSSLTGS